MNESRNHGGDMIGFFEYVFESFEAVQITLIDLIVLWLLSGNRRFNKNQVEDSFRSSLFTNRKRWVTAGS
jgi:hypothetical protein